MIASVVKKPTVVMVTLLCGGVLSEWALQLLLIKGPEIESEFMQAFFLCSGLPFMCAILRYHPCPSFPWFFSFTKEKPQINQGFLSPAEPTETLEKPEKTHN